MTQPALQRSIQRITQTLVILLTLYYTLLGGFAVGVHESRWRLVTYILTGLLWAGWLVNRLKRKQPWPRTPLDWPLLALIVTVILSTIFSTDPRLSFDSLLLTLAYGLCFYFAVDLVKNRVLTETIINAMLLTALVICAVGLFEYWQWYYGDWLGEVNRRAANIPWSLSTSRRIKSVLNNPNILAYYLLPILGLSLYKLSYTHNRLIRLGWSAWILLGLAIIFLTQSRGGLLGAITVLIIFGGLQLAGLGVTRASSLDRFRAWLYLAIGLAAIFGLLLLLWPIISRTSNIGSFNLGQRDSIWRIALATIGAFPWLGSGPGTFGQQYLIFRDTGNDFLHSHAHNLWLTLTAEEGFIGLVAILWLNLAFLWAISSSLPATQKSQRGLVIAALAALGGMTVHNLLDDFLDYPMLTLYAIFLAVLSLNLPQDDTLTAPATSKWANLPNLLATILAVMMGGSALWFQPAFAAYDLARASAAKDNWTQAAQYLEQAVAGDPHYHFYQQQLTLVYGKLAPKDDALLAQAIAQQTNLLQQSSHYSLDYANLACLHQQANNLPTAIQAMTQAIALEPAQIQNYRSWRVSRLAYQFSLVQLYEQHQQAGPAQELSVQILAVYPWATASPFWTERPQQLQTLINRIEHSMNDASPGSLIYLADLYYYAGDAQRSVAIIRQLLNNQSQDGPILTRLSRALFRLEEVEAALTTLNQALALEPYNPEARLIRAQVFMQQNKIQDAEADLRVLIATTPGAEAYTVWGQLAEQQGLLLEAKQRYQQAVLAATALETGYAYVIWRREPLPEEALPCVLIPYTPQQLSQPALALGHLLESEGNPTAALQVYRLLLRFEPYNYLAQKQLTRLTRLCKTTLNLCDESLSDTR